MQSKSASDAPQRSDDAISKDRGLLVVLSGPSGVGKTTIAKDILKRFGGTFSVSATTRPQATGEVNGRDYYFISDEQFQAKREGGEFLECANVFGKHWYGTPRQPVEQQLALGRIVLLDIDVQGGIQVRKSMPNAFMMFIKPPSEEELLRRLRSRGRDDEQAIQRRFAEAKNELALANESGAYDAVIVNDDLEQAIEQIHSLIENTRRGQRDSASPH